MEKLSCPTDIQPKKQRKITGVTPKLYKSFKQSLAELDVPAALGPLIKDSSPELGFLRIWPEEGRDTPLVHCRFGLVPKGSILSYQQPLTAKKSLNFNSDISAPDFNFPTLSFPPIVLEENQQLHFDSLQITDEQSKEFELQTREQSFSKDWYRLRKFRLTASNFKSICSRQKDFEALATRLLKGTKIQTAAMKYGLEHEDEVAQFYAQNFGRSVFKVGFVINPRVPHLGCSPDRRVYDPSESSPWGLLEIKCSMAEELKDIKYLKKNPTTGVYSLKKSHQYYFQVMGFVGLTGEGWSDFFVQCKKEFHYERIYYDAEFFSNMMEKLNLFYFCYYLPALVASK